MAEKYTKAPGIFKKPVKKSRWEKYLKRIYLPQDREFLESLGVEENGLVVVDVSKLAAKEYKRLKILGKTIKANRKSLNFIIIFILVIIIGGGIFFQLYLKNNLVRKLVETRLERIFLAEVDAEGVNLSVFKGEFTVGYLAVADASSPMTNLFEISGIRADLKTSELLQGRIFIEELGFSGLVRGGTRKVSGALDEEELADGDAASAEEAPALHAESDGKVVKAGEGVAADVVAQISALAGEIDVEEILEQQKDNLESLRLIDESRSRIDQYREIWETRGGEWSSRIDAWESSVKYISTLNAESFTSVESSRSAIDRLQGIYADAERDYAEVGNDYAAARKHYDDSLNMMNGIKKAVEADYKYIESLVTLPAGEKAGWAASVLEDQLSLPMKRYLSYLDRGWEWYGRFKKLAEIRENREPEKRRDGRSLPAPADAPPGFVLVHAFASGEEPGINYRFDLDNLVSQPGKWPDKASLKIGLDTASTGAAGAVITEDGLKLSVPAAPFDLSDTLKGLDIASLSGTLAVESEAGWNEDGFKGRIDLVAEKLDLAAGKENSILFRLINTAVEAVKPVSAGGDFIWNEADGLGLSIETDLDEGLSDAVRALVSEGAEEALGRLQDYLGLQLAGPLEELESAAEELEDLIEQIKSYQTEIDSYRRQAEDKIAEIRRSVEDNLRKEAEALIKDAIPADVEKEIDDAADLLKKNLGGALKF